MGHINLAAPIVHIWFFKALPSRLGAMLDMKTSDVEKVVYFQDYVVVDPGKTPLKKKQLLTEEEYRSYYDQYPGEFEAEMGADAIKRLLGDLDMTVTSAAIREEIETTGSKQKMKDPDQAPQDDRGHPRQREPRRVDDHGRDPGHPAGPASLGAPGVGPTSPRAI